MKTCTICHELKAESQMHRLGVDELPVCKSCERKAHETPEHAELNALTIAARALDSLPLASQARALRMLSARYAC